ncbi:MAG: arsenosugar biosynthesis radical SAM protein ArsS [Gammaproteobacteria bacterium]|nr:arsenosugar biosynthesis radical SAM protein ArsS [Gammaproteobacteria bacterium]
MLDTRPHLEEISFPDVRRGELQTLQVNLGYLCNLQCRHCHVNAGPKRTEVMAEETIADLIQFLRNSEVTTLDLTGGAPEMNPHFRTLVGSAREMGIRVIDRCNLVVLKELPWLASFLAEQDVDVVASLPCYLEENVDTQRGKGSYDDSIAGLKQLNALGYGRDSDRVLNLVFNPQGASLPPDQNSLEIDYKKYLGEQFGISFDNLLTIANMPINRFGSQLLSKGEFNEYVDLLKRAHSDANLETVMCRTLVSVDWQGYLYDCDFNQMLKLPINGKQIHISQLAEMKLDGCPIAVMGHCYGCTAGAGSSCGGALS